MPLYSITEEMPQSGTEYPCGDGGALVPIHQVRHYAKDCTVLVGYLREHAPDHLSVDGTTGEWYAKRSCYRDRTAAFMRRHPIACTNPGCWSGDKGYGYLPHESGFDKGIKIPKEIRESHRAIRNAAKKEKVAAKRAADKAAKDAAKRRAAKDAAKDAEKRAS